LLDRLLKSVLIRTVPGRNLELSVALVGEKKIRELNRDYLSKDEVTDVLAFPLMTPEELAVLPTEGGGSPEPLGDIVICLPRAVEQATQRGISELEEVQLLAVHGFLHLIGFSDESDEDSDRMAEMETELLGRDIIS